MNTSALSTMSEIKALFCKIEEKHILWTGFFLLVFWIISAAYLESVGLMMFAVYPACIATIAGAVMLIISQETKKHDDGNIVYHIVAFVMVVFSLCVLCNCHDASICFVEYLHGIPAALGRTVSHGWGSVPETIHRSFYGSGGK